MNNYHYIILIILIQVIFYCDGFTQTDSTNIVSEDILENIIAEPDEEGDDSELFNVLEDLSQNPIDINTADLLELQKLPNLDALSAQRIIEHRKKFGSFFSPYELFSIREIDKDILTNIIPFVKTTESEYDDNQIVKEVIPDKKKLFTNSKVLLRSRVTNDLQNRNGFLNDKFAGSKPKIYNRILYSYNSKYRLGFLTEKDAGEKSITDFTSFHFQVKDVEFINNLIAGDYILEFGQGLVLWSPYGFSKGSDAIYPIKKRSGRIRPYTSAAEYRFFRGGAATISLSGFNITGFYSRKSFDASIDPITNEITSISKTGFHRTENEISKLNTVNSTLAGGVIEYKYLGRYSAGVIYYNTSFSKTFEQKSVFELNTNNLNYTSFFYDLNFTKVSIFGEAAYDGRSVASFNGVQFLFSNNFIFTTSIRSYPRNFRNIYGFGFGEQNGKTQNEFGIYTGFRWKLPVGIINFYFDQFKFPFSTFENTLPSDGNEFLFDFSSKPLSKLEARLRYKYENKEVTELLDDKNEIVKRLKQSIRTEIIYDLSNNLRLKGRFEFNDFAIRKAGKTENGYLILQDIRFSPINNLRLNGRIIFFRTDSFNSAVYEYENDLVGILSNLPMFGEGMRWYLTARYKPINWLSLSAKYSETYKPKESKLSSGDNEILGNVDNRISFQIDVSF